MGKRIFLALTVLFAGMLLLNAVPARPGKMVYIQPDGSKIIIERHGDEFGHWTTDAMGRVVKKDKDGFFRPVSDDASASSVRLNAAARRSAARKARAASAAGNDSHVAIGKKHFLVILVEFKDLSFSTSEDPKAAFTALLNEPGYSVNGGTGSARDFYYDNSNGVFEPVFDVYGPVRMDTTKAYYGANNRWGDDIRAEQAVISGCEKLDEEIDFSRYDNDGDGQVDLVFMYYAGYGEADSSDDDAIWPHQWELSNAGYSLSLDGKVIDHYACSNEVVGYGALRGKMCGIGTACHEFGHAMGLPDMYDIDYETNGEAGGLYSYSTMCGGSYNNEGRTPPYFNFEERIYLGWLEDKDYLEFKKTGTYEIPPIDGNVAYRTFTDMDGEYFIYENRTKAGWDRYLPGEGLVVYHADKSSRQISTSYGTSTAHDLWYHWEALNSINENGSHPCFYIIPAASQSSLNYSREERIPFPYQNVNTYTPKSWNNVNGAITFSEIAFSGGRLTLKATVPSDDLDYVTIANAGSYRAGDRFTFALRISDNATAPESVVWYFDDEPVQSDSVTLTAGAHTVEAVLTQAGGRTEILTLEIDAQ